MADKSPVKISQLPEPTGTGINDSDIFAASRITGADKLETQRITVSELRKLMDYGNAFSDLNAAIAATVKDQQFYVFVDDSKEFVYRYVNMGGIASPVLSADGTPVKEPTKNLLRNLGDIKSQDGFGLVGAVTSFDALRKLTPRAAGWRVYLAGYYEGTTLGSGFFVSKSGVATDDQGVIAVVNGSYYWERVLETNESIPMDYYGIRPGDDISDKLNFAVIAAKVRNIVDISLPGTPFDKPFILSKKVDIDLTDGKVIFIKGACNKIGTIIQHRFDGTAFYFHRNHVSSKNFWNTGGIENVTITCHTDYQQTATAAAIQISDTWGFIVNRVRILNFKAGNGIVVKNETAWTEGTKITDVDIRATQNGVLFTRDVTNDKNTNSFFGTYFNQYSFQAGTGKAGTSAIRVGDAATDAANKTCVLYGSEIQFRYWAEGGGANFGLMVSSSGQVTSGNTLIIPDGVGLSANDTITATPLKCIAVRGNGTYLNNTTIEPYQGRMNCFKVKDINFALEALLSFEKGVGVNSTLFKGRPVIDPKGLRFYTYQEFTGDEIKDGFSVGMTNLPVGTRLRVVLRYSTTDNDDNSRISSYIVSVGGAGMFTTVAPENIAILNNVTTTKSAVSGTDVVTDVGINDGRSRLNDWVDTATSPRVVNGNATQTNKDGYGTNARNFRIVVPANPAATATLKLGVEVEFI
ncbi:tail fiber protein [Serratia phage Moabite]|uniref:Tail fiber protein n=1 Tax=Serratia phage Moabite TaxID=2587814 RepID=A0A4Y5TPC5_9CAUD|nr:tail fiber protein [Serratia phage Moabite]QDB71224.1 tail fiber protein [Serratia phage Moabite]UGO54080.1 putative tail fibers protein [Serratia phage vB_SmaM_Haymo]